MYRLTFFIGILLFGLSCSQPKLSIERSPSRMVNKDGVHVGVYSFEEFKPFLKAPNDSIYVLNFWATWCGPCVKELPYFEKLQANYKDKGVRVILVSLDFLKQLEDKLVPFMQKKQLKSEVIVLDQKGGTDWMSEIEESWEGALPATIIYKGNKRVFNAKSYDYEELEAELKPFL